MNPLIRLDRAADDAAAVQITVSVVVQNER